MQPTRASTRNISKYTATLAEDSDDEIMNDPDADVDPTVVASEDGDPSDSDENSSGSDNDDEVVILPKKRKHAAATESTDDEEEEETVIIPKKRKYTKQSKESTIKEMKEKKSARTPVTEIVTLNSGNLWPALRTHILSKINIVLKPHVLLFSDYEVSFTLPRHVGDPMKLNDEEKYKYLIKKALLIKKDPNWLGVARE
ncbi:hypothetical protein B0H16DRAFT_1703815 [Mycena metata]|uniref:Uncharacterized protein n=1 Tax=Mycena metata TaxID=1033252 RepID=A0AAD7MBH6_9AGAR|nr:hypothetical protein B0H16DRAFT_1703815 [Mycena metata]